MNVLVYVDIDQEKMKVAQNEKPKKLHWFCYYKNIANFEAFLQDKNFSKNLLFLGSELLKSTEKKKNYTDFSVLIELL